MNIQYLLPAKYRTAGIVIFTLGAIGFLYSFFVDSEPEFFDWEVFAIFNRDLFMEVQTLALIQNNVFLEIVGVLLIVGALFISFSKLKDEDEMTMKIRLESLMWAVYVNHALLLISLIFVYGWPFFLVMSFNLFTTLIIFMVKFKWALYKVKQAVTNEE